MKSIRCLAAVGAVLVASAVAVAQDQPKTAKPAAEGKSAAAPMPIPTPAPETKKLAFMAGNFTSDEHFFPNPMMPQETRSKGTLEGRFVLGDFFLATEVKSEAMGGFKGHSYVKYDTDKKQYVMHWFDSWGSAQEYTNGQWKDDKSLAFECDSECFGKPVRLRSVYIVTSPTTWTLKEEADFKDGKGYIPTMEIQFKKSSN